MKTENEQIKEIYSDIDELMSKILKRLDSQSNIIVAMTKLRVARLFIKQIANGGNKVFLSNELRKIEDKIKVLPKDKPDENDGLN